MGGTFVPTHGAHSPLSSTLSTAPKESGRFRPNMPGVIQTTSMTFARSESAASEGVADTLENIGILEG